MNLRLGLLVVFLLAIGTFFYFGLYSYLSFEYLQQHRSTLLGFYESYPLLTLIVFFATYVAVTGLSIPGATILTLAAGALFGLVTATVVVSLASTLGATLAFLLARFLFRDAIQKKFADKLRAVNRGIEQEGSFYLFTLRLVPAFPFFLVNLTMGLTAMKPSRFFLISLIGMFPGTLIYVNAGTELAELHSLEDILSPSLLISLAMLGVFPLLAKKLVTRMRRNPA